MENKEFNLQEYMSKNIEGLVKGIIKTTLKNPKESMFMMKFASNSKKLAKIRKEYEDKGEHIPPFLIASITSLCNLHCAGCYSRTNNATVDAIPVKQLSSSEWKKIFVEAKDLGINFILLAGGEPLIRADVIKAAGEVSEIMFPIFTNGIFMDEYFKIFSKYRNLVPIMSIEGDKNNTDKRRGEGVYDKLISNMNELKKKGIIFGASITVTKENIEEVTSVDYLTKLAEKGCKGVIFVEFVPVTDEAKELAPDEENREYLLNRLKDLRKTHNEMVYIAFPGDEKNLGGCVSAGRGFFHINSHGGAEPCPFSPYSDINVINTSLYEAINSPLFKAIKESEALKEDHVGGCVLYEKKDIVEALLLKNNSKI